MIENPDPPTPARRPHPAGPRPGPLPDAMAAQVNRLRFSEPGLEAEFRADYFAGALAGVRVNLALGVVLFGLWALVDRVVIPGAAGFTLPVRLGVACPVLLGVLLISFSARFDRLMTPCLVLVDLVCGGVMVAIIGAAGADGHRYYHAGLMICAIGNCACPGLRFRAAMAVNLLIFSAYGAALRAGAAPEVLLNNAMFLLTAGLLAASVSYTLERQHRSGFLQRWVIREQSEALRQVLLEVDRTSRTDSLTGLYNRRHFFDEASERPGPGPGRVSVIILDVDHFKSINDRFGHAAGDRVLREVGRRVRAAVRPGDVACRYGGEEFAVLLRGADLPTAASIGERVRRDVEVEPFEAGPAPLRVTVSAGIASATEGEAAAIEALIDRADQALYQAKNAGRNRVRLWDRAPARAETA